jgi:hypothetical protein
MFLIMGLVHLFACVVLIIGTPDNLTAIWANFIIGAIELSIGVFLFIKNEEFV